MSRVIFSFLVILLIIVGWSLCSTIEQMFEALVSPQRIACADIYGKRNANTGACAPLPIQMDSVWMENGQRMTQDDFYKNYAEKILTSSGDAFGFLSFKEMEEYIFICCLPITMTKDGLQTYGSELWVLESIHTEKRVPELNLSNWDEMGFQAMFPNIVLNLIKN